MIPSFETLKDSLKKLPGLGYRSAERIALHLLVEKPDALNNLVKALNLASDSTQPCSQCGNLAQEPLCDICSDPARDPSLLCIVESIPDLYALERSGSFNGLYHVLHGKLSPVKGILPEHLNLDSLSQRIEGKGITEVLLAFPADIESEATCHYIQQNILKDHVSNVTRLGFGLPSGSNITFTDPQTLKNALETRTNLT